MGRSAQAPMSGGAAEAFAELSRGVSDFFEGHGHCALQPPATMQLLAWSDDYQRKFRSSNFRLYWKLPVGLAASTLDRRDVLQHGCETWEILAGRNCTKCCVFPYFRGFEGSQKQVPKTGVAKDRLPKMSRKFAPRLHARAIWKSKSLKAGRFGALLEVELRKISTTPARESDLEVKIVKNWRCRGTFGSWASQNLHHACARERFGSQNR